MYIFLAIGYTIYPTHCKLHLSGMCPYTFILLFTKCGTVLPSSNPSIFVLIEYYDMMGLISKNPTSFFALTYGINSES